ncbi:hypothetical protein D3C74_380530 [compost metagenome]
MMNTGPLLGAAEAAPAARGAVWSALAAPAKGSKNSTSKSMEIPAAAILRIFFKAFPPFLIYFQPVMLSTPSRHMRFII